MPSLLPTFFPSFDLPRGSTFTERKWLQRSCCLAKDGQLSPLGFPPRPGRLEMRGVSWDAPALAWHGMASIHPLPSRCRQKRGCSYSPLSTLPKWPSSRGGQVAVRVLISSTLKELPHQTLHELQEKERAIMC